MASIVCSPTEVARYKGIHKPTCKGGHGCRLCWRKYIEKPGLSIKAKTQRRQEFAKAVIASLQEKESGKPARQKRGRRIARNVRNLKILERRLKRKQAQQLADQASTKPPASDLDEILASEALQQLNSQPGGQQLVSEMFPLVDKKF